MMEWLNPRNWSVFEDQENTLHFTRVFTYVLMASVFIGGAAMAVGGLVAGIIVCLSLLISGFIIALLISSAQNSIGNFIGGGLFLGSKKKDDEAIVKGMYKQAHGLTLVDKHEEAEKVYAQISEEYPDELDAQYYRGMELWKSLDKPKKALRIFNGLERKIKIEKLNYQYSSSLKKSIEELKEEMELSS